MKVTNPISDKKGSDRVLRGGSWDEDARGARSSSRLNLDPSFRYYSLGFRLVRNK